MVRSRRGGSLRRRRRAAGRFLATRRRARLGSRRTRLQPGRRTSARSRIGRLDAAAGRHRRLLRALARSSRRWPRCAEPQWACALCVGSVRRSRLERAPAPRRAVALGKRDPLLRHRPAPAARAAWRPRARRRGQSRRHLDRRSGRRASGLDARTRPRAARRRTAIDSRRTLHLRAGHRLRRLPATAAANSSPAALRPSGAARADVRRNGCHCGCSRRSRMADLRRRYRFATRCRANFVRGADCAAARLFRPATTSGRCRKRGQQRAVVSAAGAGKLCAAADHPRTAALCAGALRAATRGRSPFPARTHLAQRTLQRMVGNGRGTGPFRRLATEPRPELGQCRRRL